MIDNATEIVCQAHDDIHAIETIAALAVGGTLQQVSIALADIMARAAASRPGLKELASDMVKLERGQR